MGKINGIEGDLPHFVEDNNDNNYITENQKTNTKIQQLPTNLNKLQIALGVILTAGSAYLHYKNESGRFIVWIAGVELLSATIQAGIFQRKFLLLNQDSDSAKSKNHKYLMIQIFFNALIDFSVKATALFITFKANHIYRDASLCISLERDEWRKCKDFALSKINQQGLIAISLFQMLFKCQNLGNLNISNENFNRLNQVLKYSRFDFIANTFFTIFQWGMVPVRPVQSI